MHITIKRLHAPDTVNPTPLYQASGRADNGRQVVRISTNRRQCWQQCAHDIAKINQQGAH